MKSLLRILTLTFTLGHACAAQEPPLLKVPPRQPANEEFLKAADEVLADVSKLVALPVKEPLKKSIRTREEIRDYVVREMYAEREAAKWDADQKALEKFGLIPRGFPLQKFLVDLLTEQIAGLYDPKGKEFYIADWIPLEQQRMVMSHEMVHALQDQHFGIEAWSDAAKPNDDAQLARHAVLEGAAIAGMVDYMLRSQNLSSMNLPDLQALIRSQMVGEVDKDSTLGKAPAYIRDTLLFPYLGGTSFTQAVLRANDGWAGFSKVFAKPPVSTQQILHPNLYLSGTVPPAISLDDALRALPAVWQKLDVNTLGELGLHSALKQFLGEDRAARLSPAWAADKYAVLQHEKTKRVLLLFRLRLDSADNAARFFGSYSEALELKNAERTNLLRRPNFFSFDTNDGGVFLYCHGDECLSVEGGDRAIFDQVTRALRWPDAPQPAARSNERIAFLPQHDSMPAAACR